MFLKLKLSLVALVTLLAASAFAGKGTGGTVGSASISYNNKVTTRLIINQIVSRQMLPAGSGAFYEILGKILEGSGTVTITKLTCEAVLGGTDDCMMQIVSIPELEEGQVEVKAPLTFKLEARIPLDGQVTSARIVGREG